MVVYKAFDILMLDGEDLRPLPLSARKRRLEVLLKHAKSKTLFYVEAVVGDGAKVYAEACKLGLEGIVSKRIDSRYRAGRSDHWQKVPVRRRRDGGGGVEPMRPMAEFAPPTSARSGSIRSSRRHPTASLGPSTTRQCRSC